jgi:exosortase A-associated hydrolase 2
VNHSLEAFHIPSSQGSLAAVYHKPEVRGHVSDLLFIHGFAHEHYIARPILASVWRNLAASGTGVLSLDLPGCGDSAGDLGDATWGGWLSAIATAQSWLQSSNGLPVWLGGLRLGALLALESAEHLDCRKLLLLQPVIRGEEMLTQFLRLRVAFSGLRADAAEKVTTQSLRQRLAAGETLEVGGFLLSPALAAKIDGLAIDSYTPPGSCSMSWVNTGKGPLPPAVDALIVRWRELGLFVSASSVDVKPYWVHTRGLAEEYGQLVREIAGQFFAPLP